MNLSDCGLNDIDCETVCMILLMSKLNILDLSENLITEKGAYVLFLTLNDK